MKIDLQSHGTVTVLAPHGPLIAEELDEFRRVAVAAIAEKQGRVVIDCGDISYLDSGGIEALLSIHAESMTPARPRLAELTDVCREALDLTNVLDRLEVFETVENAIRSFKR